MEIKYKRVLRVTFLILLTMILIAGLTIYIAALQEKPPEHPLDFQDIKRVGLEKPIKSAEDRLLGRVSNDEPTEYDMIFGEAEYPYFDFVGIEDRWLPSKESVENAIDGKFDACIVRFASVGQLLVPWSRKKFKAEIAKFAEQYEAEKAAKESEKREIRVITLTPQQLEGIMQTQKPDENE